MFSFALTTGVVKLNAVKVLGDGIEESYQSQFTPHVLIDVKAKSSARGFLKRDTPSIVIKYTQLTYFVEFEIGSNKDKVLLSLDSGSADFWVNGANNKACMEDPNNSPDITNLIDTLQPVPSSEPAIHWGDNNQCYIITTGDDNSLSKRDDSDPGEIEFEGCLGFGVFDSDNSTTFKESDIKFDIKYQDNSTSNGIMGTDDIHIGDFKVPGVTFGVNEQSTSNGILGLGFPVNQAGYQLDNERIYDNLPTVMKKNGLINKIVYSLKASIASEESQSQLIFGGYDKNSFTGQLTLLPIIDYKLPTSNRRGEGPYYVSVTVNSMTFDDESSPFATGASAAILDSGSVGSFFPGNVILSIVNHYGFKHSEDLQGFVISESKIKDTKLIFNFQGSNIEVPLIYFTYPILDNETYDYSGLRILSVTYYNGEEIDYFILGDDFLSMVTFVVDMEDKIVAIAQANLEQQEENIVIVSNEIPDAIKASQWDSIYGSNGQTTLSIVGKQFNDSDTVNMPSNETANLNNQFIPGYGLDVGWV